ncbi:MAG TPA: DUF6339 family protein [Virgibacillus sp.]|nr:DUF6339 family protein [Virgibacillus sp.]HLR66906.1 DUF6339 family protein [Virgibacillus sp.]
MNNLIYVTDGFLDEFKTNFEEKYLQLYKSGDVDKIKKIFQNPENILKSEKKFTFKPLKLESQNPDSTIENIKTIRKSLGNLNPTEAENEKLWVALENTYYLEYHLDQLNLINSKNINKSIKGRTIFTESRKRSLMMNNLGILWWIGYYTIDSDSSDPFYYTRYFVEEPYRGHALAYMSSNIVSNKEIVLGTLQAIKQLVDNNKLIRNRYSFTNANKILNQIGGVRIIDTLSREEVKEIILDNLLETNKIRIPQTN